ncbi:MAG: lysozyme, partial [Thermocrispum sp.]
TATLAPAAQATDAGAAKAGQNAAAPNPYANAGDHHAGSQIATHEGRPKGAGPQLRRPLGNDVSGWQGDVNWRQVKRKGGKFSYVKATEGTGYRNPHFSQQYNGAYRAGLIRGAYHFARPDLTGGGKQARYFVRHGGKWSRDGKTLPGALDMEYNPYGKDKCYGLSKRQMRSWIRAFVRTYADRAGRLPTIYTSTSWWKLCTGNSGAFARNPLWIARYNDHIGALPKGWKRHTIWQFSDRGKLPGDQNYFNGSMRKLRKLAKG